MNDYYVYIYWRLDTNEPFYVGKGKGDRWKRIEKTRRKEHFRNIVNKYDVVCEIIKDNLTEDQAHEIECWLINELVFEYGYSIDIENNRSREKGCHLVNCTWGGEGVSGYKHTEEEKKMIGESCKLMWENENLRKDASVRSKERWKNKEYKNKMSEKLRGENNPMYGKSHSEESKRKISETMKGKYCGENNPMWGKNPRDYMTEDAKREYDRKISERTKGKNNPNAKSVICLTTKKIFITIQEAMNEYGIKGSSDIGNCCRKKRKSAGKYKGKSLKWKYLIWNHNKRFRIKK